MPSSSDPSRPQPRILSLKPGGATNELQAHVRAALSRGALVAMPTETVYGIAARADEPAALERLRAAKGRPAELPLTWHVGNASALASFNKLRPLAERLAAAYWPGPLTMVLEGVPQGLEATAMDGATGLRFPAHPATAQILEGLDFPVVMTSANRHSEPALADAAALAEVLGSQIELILDDGPNPINEGSAVLRLTPGRFELLRSGLMDLESLRRTAGLKIGFVCTGNTCRSPMAEGLARDLLESRLGSGKLADFGFEVSSMGVYAGPGAAPSPHAVEVLKQRGINIAGHRSQSVPMARLDEFDALYCLTHSHMQALLQVLPKDGARAVQLLDPKGRDVSDPIGGSLGDYEACAKMILAAIQARAQNWA